MGILSWILFGLIAGALSKFIMPGKYPGGILITMVLGLVGGILGGFIGKLLGWGGVTEFSLGSLVLAIVGSLILLAAYRYWLRRKLLG